MKLGDVLRSAFVRSRNWVKGVPRQTRGDMAALVVLVGLFITAYSLGQREPAGSDDTGYFTSVESGAISNRHHGQRYVLLASVWLAQAVFGFNLTGYYAVGFCYGLGVVLASYLLARCFVGPLLAFVAGVMVIALPDFLSNSSVLMPDVPGQFWLVFGVLAFVRYFTAEPESPSLRRWGVLSSLSFFFAASAKEALALALLGLICFPLAFLRSKEKWLRFVTMALGVAALEGVQTLILWAVYGDPLHRIHAVSSGHLPQMEFYARTPGKMPQNIDWSHLSVRFLELTNSQPAYAAGPLFGYWHLLLGSLVVALAAAIWKRQRLLLGFAGFVLVAYSTLTFTIVSLDPLIPAVRTLGRYFVAVLTFLPVFIVAGWGLLLGDVSERISTKRGRIAYAVLFAVVCLLYTATAYAAASYHVTHYDRAIRNTGRPLVRIGASVRRYVREHPEIRRVLGPHLIRAGAFSWGLDIELRGMRRELMSRFKLKKDDLVVMPEPALVMSNPDLVWQRIGNVAQYQMAHVSEVGDAHPAGEWETLVLHSEQIPNTPRTRVLVRLKLRAKDVELERAELVAYEKDARRLDRKTWSRNGDIYTVTLKSRPIRTRGLRACTLRFTASGPGTFEILEREVTFAKP